MRCDKNQNDFKKCGMKFKKCPDKVGKRRIICPNGGIGWLIEDYKFAKEYSMKILVSASDKGFGIGA